MSESLDLTIQICTFILSRHMTSVARFSGSKLRERRLAEGLSQAGLSIRSGVREQQINRWEGSKSKKGPSIDTVALLAAALRCEITDLLETDGAQPSGDDDEEDALLEAAHALDRVGDYALADRLRRRARVAAQAARVEQERQS